MKSEDLRKLLDNAELTTDQKVAEIHRLNGIDIATERGKYSDYDDLKANASKYSDYDSIKMDRDRLKATADQYKDYDAIVKERDELVAERDTRLFTERFEKALGTAKPKNDFTKQGLVDLFRAEVGKDENKGKEDAEIFSAIVKGHETEYFDSPVSFRMAPINPQAKAPTEIQAFLDAEYKNNPFYKPN